MLVPTRELAEQVHANIREYAENLPVSTYAVYGGVSLNPQMMRLRRGVDLLVATPGRLLDLFRQNAVKFGQVQTLVLDEADRMLDLGFAEELQAVYAALPRKRQTLLFSATFSDQIRMLAGLALNDPLSIEVSPRNTTASTVKQWLVPVDKKRKADLFCHLLRKQRWKQVLVFAKTRNGVDQLVERLLAEGVNADGIHGDRPQATRQRALDTFKAREIKCWWQPMSLPVAWISTTCRWWSTSICRSWPKTMCTASGAPDVQETRARRFRWCAPMKCNCWRPSRR